MGNPELPPKKDVMLALLERTSVYIHCDPRHESVRVPPWLKKQPQLVLQVGLNMAVRIPDLSVEEDAVCCTLSFNRSPFFCYLPWNTVFALVGEDGKGMLWPNDVPKEVAAQQAEQARKEEARARLRPAGEVAARTDPPRIEAAGTAAATEARKADKPGSKRKGSPLPVGGPRRNEPVAPAEGAPKAAEPSAPATRESKRALPPYLRVVK